MMHHACMPGMLVLEKNCGEKLGDSTAVYELFANLYNFKNYTYSFLWFNTSPRVRLVHLNKGFEQRVKYWATCDRPQPPYLGTGM